METKDFYDDEFVINLTIDGTSYKEVEVIVSEPYLAIQDQIERIVSVFELPKIDNGGNPLHYLLGQIMVDDEELVVLEQEDEDGGKLCLIDYDVQPGAHLHLIACPIAGYACPIPMEMEREWELYCLNKM